MPSQLLIVEDDSREMLAMLRSEIARTGFDLVIAGSAASRRSSGIATCGSERVHEIRPLPRGAIARYTGRWREGDRTLTIAASVLFVLADLQIAEIGVRLDLTRVHELAA